MVQRRLIDQPIQSILLEFELSTQMTRGRFEVYTEAQAIDEKNRSSWINLN